MSKPIHFPDRLIAKELFKARLPYFVPEATMWLQEHILDTDFVLEVGGGGSTLFFADRCEVLTFEPVPAMVGAIKRALRKDKLAAMVRHGIPQGEPTTKHTILEVDTNPPYDRTWIEQKLYHPGVRIIIRDNYADFNTWKSLPLLPEGFVWRDFDHPNWTGKGTRILWREP